MTSLEQQKKETISLASAKQRQASTPTISVWVEASAGTGKTKVLSDRVMRLLLSGVRPERILCLTYTKAAAVEMSNRIADKLSKWATLEEQILKNELEKLLGAPLSEEKKDIETLTRARQLFAILLDTPGGIKIQTIHAFCQEVLKRFPLEAKISPYFEIMDDRSSREALESIKKDILQGNVDAQTADALSFLTAEAGESKFPEIMQDITTNRNLIDETLKIHKTLPNLLEAIAKKLDISPSETKEDILKNFWNLRPQEDISLIIKALDAGTDTSRKTAIALASAIEQSDFETYSKLFLTDGRLRKNFLVKKSKEEFPLVEQAAQEEALRIAETAKHLKSLHLFQSTSAVLTLSAEILARYRHYKERQSKMDYNDLIILTKNLLNDPKVAQWILFKLDGGIDNILIDEAQDTSPEQWSIVKSLTEDFFSGAGAHLSVPTVFVVGDRKQSIYSFQGADPAEFEKMHTFFAEKDASFRTVNMDVSFRSTAAVLDIVNTVFNSDKARTGVLSDEQTMAHFPSRLGEAGRVELWPLTSPEEDDKSDNIFLPPIERIKSVSASSLLAQQIAQLIKAKVDSKELLPSQNRPLRYKDFLILVQRRNSFVEEMVRACKNIGVEVAGVDKIKLSEQIAVTDLTAIAKFALLPEDDLNLACILKSPLLGLDDDDLFKLCYQRNSQSLWNRLQENASYSDQTNLLKDLLTLAQTARPFEFFNYILSNLNGRKKFVARLGNECEDALDEFMNLTLNFEQDHIPSLQLFIKWMEQDDVEIKRNLEQNDSDAVRLMTVHGSKGLQAPVVILPDTVRVKRPKQDAGFLKGGGLLFYPLSKNDYETNCQNLKETEAELSLDEYHRLLYVALTRAEDCLCICGYKKKNNPNEDCWYNLCKDALEKIADKTSDDKLVYELKQILPSKDQKPETAAKQTPPLPVWLNQAPKAESPLAKPLTPSHQDETTLAALSPLTADTSKLYTRGRLIHKMLQFLPSTATENQEQLIRDFLAKQALDYSPAEQNSIATEVLNLISNPKFAPLFGTDSLAEVSLMGQVEDKIISGQIDRLVVTKDSVMIVDYKTNRPAAKSSADIPQAYIKQMRAYKKIISKIYPDKKILTYILWTNTAQIMLVE